MTATHDHPRRPSRQWRGLRPDTHQPAIVNCHRHHATGLCDPCLLTFDRVLSDVPYLLDDLDVAIAGTVEFVERGQRKDQADEEPKAGGGGNPAVAAHHRLVSALQLAADWFDARHPEQLADQLRRVLPELANEPHLRRIAREVSQAASRAHRVVDAPADLWYYGPCPECGSELLQERIHRDDHDTLIQCRRCDYADKVGGHNATQLAARQDSWLTITELLSAFMAGGLPVTRHQIERWAARDGLPRELRARPRWINGALQTNEVWTYRVRDVQDMITRAEAKRTRTAG